MILRVRLRYAPNRINILFCIILQASKISSWFLSGDVGCNIRTRSNCFFQYFSDSNNACFKTGKSLTLSPDKPAGLINGTSIPLQIASSLINSESVETTILSIKSTNLAQLTACPTRVLPFIFLRFLI